MTIIYVLNLLFEWKEWEFVLHIEWSVYRSDQKHENASNLSRFITILSDICLPSIRSSVGHSLANKS